MEKNIEIVPNGQFNNIYPKKALEENEYVVVEKLFAEGLMKEKTQKNKKGEEYTSQYYIIKVLYKDEEVSFFMGADEYVSYEAAGGVGDKIKLIKTEEKAINSYTKLKYIKERIKTELVQE